MAYLNKRFVRFAEKNLSLTFRVINTYIERALAMGIYISAATNAKEHGRKGEKKNVMEQNKEELARRIREIGESLIKNAESIVGTEEYIKSIHIFADVTATDRDPVINIDKEFCPERFVERRVEGFGPNDI